MTTIPTNFGDGGANLTSAGSNGTPTLAQTLRDVATDLETLRTSVNAGITGLSITSADPAAVSAGALAAFTNPPTAGEMANTRTLVNELRTTAIATRTLALELKGDLNTLAPGTITSPDPTAVSAVALPAFTDPPTAPEMAALRTLVNEVRTTVIETRTLAIEVKTKANAAFDPAGTLLTQLG